MQISIYLRLKFDKVEYFSGFILIQTIASKWLWTKVKMETYLDMQTPWGLTKIKY